MMIIVTRTSDEKNWKDRRFGVPARRMKTVVGSQDVSCDREDSAGSRKCQAAVYERKYPDIKFQDRKCKR